MAASALARIIVLGGGYAGLTAAARMSERGIGAVTLVDAKDEFVERIRLHEVAAGTTPRTLPYVAFLAGRGGSFVKGTIRAIDPAARAVTVDRAGGGAERLPYDVLVYALGSRTDLSGVPGAAAHAVGLDDVPGARALHAMLQERGGKAHVLVVGGGLTAIEAATEFAERWPSLSVSVALGQTFGPEDRPGGLSPAAVAHVEATFRRLGIAAHKERVARLEAGVAHLTSGRSVPFDACVWGAGFAVPRLAADAGIAVNWRGQVVTDATLRSVSHPDVIAVGDAAEVVTEPGGACRMSCAAGRPMGEAAAATAAALLGGGAPDAFGFGYVFRCVSLGREDGLIQFVDEADCPLPEIWTGARGARWKEYICRRTLNGIGFADDLGPPPDTPPQRPAKRVSA
ncbi:MAG: NAD(P)/FAD-dependent oxidoreductase [Rhodospirillales bacterium]